MKKYSISLFSILAVVIAVASAFTTNTKTSNKNLAIYFVKHAVTPQQVTYTTPVANIDKPTIFSNLGSQLGGTTESAVGLGDFEADCAPQSGKVCMVELQWNNALSGSAQILSVADAREGSYDPAP